MSDKLQTISDIIAEKRRIAKSIRDEASNGDYWDKKKANEEAEEYEWDADDIEAAYKRELGNAQKMREAWDIIWVQLRNIYYSPMYKDEPAFVKTCLRSMEVAMNHALSAPPRNCDVYSHKDALAKWSAEKENKDNGCFDEWLYHKYKQEEKR